MITTDPQKILDIPKEDLPLMVLSDNARSFFALLIRKHQKDCYNHFMFMISPGKFVSQDLTFREVPAENYLQGKHRLKFIRGSYWTQYHKVLIITKLRAMLLLPFWKRVYDPLQLIGIWLGIPWLQIPGPPRICSDYGFVLQETDDLYNLKHPSPTQINMFTKSHKDRYEVYMRFIPD